MIGVPTYSLPDDVVCYRILGPWTDSEIPAGLLKQHQLKAGSWGELTVVSGTIEFCWDEVIGVEPICLATRQRIVIPPTVPHHLQIIGDAVLELHFYK